MQIKNFVFRAIILLAILTAFKLGIDSIGGFFKPGLPDLPGRLTAYPKDLLVEVNIPEGALYLYQVYSDRQFLLKKFPCSVGTIEFKTPEGAFLTTEAVWNPGWVPPSSDWAVDFEPAKPGMSPLGNASLVVDWDEAIMIHGTNEEQTIGRPASHGCVRLREKDMTELLRFIQDNIPNSQGTANVTEYQKHPHTSVRVDLKRPVSINLVYRRKGKDDQRTVTYPDIYPKSEFRFPGLANDRILWVKRSGNLHYVLTDLQPNLVKKENTFEQLSAEPQKTGLKKTILRKYYMSAKLKFFVWYINNNGEISAWSRLLTKPY
jgi:hypothetical protein